MRVGSVLFFWHIPKFYSVLPVKRCDFWIGFSQFGPEILHFSVFWRHDCQIVLVVNLANFDAKLTVKLEGKP